MLTATFFTVLAAVAADDVAVDGRVQSIDVASGTVAVAIERSDNTTGTSGSEAPAPHIIIQGKGVNIDRKGEAASKLKANEPEIVTLKARPFDIVGVSAGDVVKLHASHYGPSMWIEPKAGV